MNPTLEAGIVVGLFSVAWALEWVHAMPVGRGKFIAYSVFFITGVGVVWLIDRPLFQEAFPFFHTRTRVP